MFKLIVSYTGFLPDARTGDENTEEAAMREYVENALADSQDGNTSCSVLSVKQNGTSGTFKVKLDCTVTVQAGEDLAAFENEEALVNSLVSSIPTPHSNGDSTELLESVATYSYVNTGTCDADNNGCAYDCFEGECICPVCWEVDGKICKPESGRFSIGCSSDKMHVWIDTCVIPHAGSVYIGEDDCTGNIGIG